MGGILTIFAADRSEIYGELSSVEWREEDTKGGPNQVLTGVAGEGTLRAFLELDRAGIDHVAFEYECAGIHYGGDAVLLRPQPTDAPTSGIITIEATKGPFLL
jgi:hypothetical protein